MSTTKKIILFILTLLISPMAPAFTGVGGLNPGGVSPGGARNPSSPSDLGARTDAAARANHEFSQQKQKELAAIAKQMEEIRAQIAEKQKEAEEIKREARDLVRKKQTWDSKGFDTEIQKSVGKILDLSTDASAEDIIKAMQANLIKPRVKNDAIETAMAEAEDSAPSSSSLVGPPAPGSGSRRGNSGPKTAAAKSLFPADFRPDRDAARDTVVQSANGTIIDSSKAYSGALANAFSPAPPGAPTGTPPIPNAERIRRAYDGFKSALRTAGATFYDVTGDDAHPGHQFYRFSEGIYRTAVSATGGGTVLPPASSD